MLDSQLQVLAVAGSLNQNSVTRAVIHQLGEALTREGCRVDIFDPVREHLPSL
jgi:NAD(P)H-dependent FMN reductase